MTEFILSLLYWRDYFLQISFLQCSLAKLTHFTFHAVVPHEGLNLFTMLTHGSQEFRGIGLPVISHTVCFGGTQQQPPRIPKKLALEVHFIVTPTTVLGPIN
jgi:hypothetical protein